MIENWKNYFSHFFPTLHYLLQFLQTPLGTSVVFRENYENEPWLLNSVKKTWSNLSPPWEFFIVSKGTNPFPSQRCIEMICEIVPGIFAPKAQENFVSPWASRSRRRRWRSTTICRSHWQLVCQRCQRMCLAYLIHCIKGKRKEKKTLVGGIVSHERPWKAECCVQFSGFNLKSLSSGMEDEVSSPWANKHSSLLPQHLKSHLICE